MENNYTNSSAPKTAPTTTSTTTTTTATSATTASTTAPATTTMTSANSAEELCGWENILDTMHLKNLVDDLSKLYSTSVCTKVARDTKVASEKRLIEAIRANLDRYKG